MTQQANELPRSGKSPAVSKSAPEQFISPLSVASPAVAAAVALLISGVFHQFGLSPKFSVILSSFLVGGVVLTRTEFKTMSPLIKIYYYLMNSLLIGAMATGGHATLASTPECPCLDAETTAPASSVSFFPVLHAASQAPTVETLVQERPFFFEVTADEFDRNAGRNFGDTNVIQVRVCKDFGPMVDFFARHGMLEPRYSVRVTLDDATSRNASSVTWTTPAADFGGDRAVSTTDSGSNFAVDVSAWKPFVIGAEFRDVHEGDVRQFRRIVAFDAAVHCSPANE